MSRFIWAPFLAALAIVALVVALSASAGPVWQTADAKPNTPPPTVAPRLDHFKCYPPTNATPHNDTVSLTDQFGSSPAEVDQAVEFCNPVRKQHKGVVTGITNPDGHLTFYRLLSPVPDPTRVLSISNQFGAQTLTVTQAVALAVPTQKLPHAAPFGLDHFRCYRVLPPPAGSGSANAPTVVNLQDQFHTENGVRVFEPVIFCNPVRKIHAGAITDIRNPLDHLTCYRIDAKAFNTQVSIVNQFGNEGLTLREANLLCVPSLKLAVGTPTPTPTPVPTRSPGLTATPTCTPNPGSTGCDTPTPTCTPDPNGLPCGSATPTCTPDPAGTPCGPGNPCDLDIQKQGFPGVPGSGTITYMITVNCRPGSGGSGGNVHVHDLHPPIVVFGPIVPTQGTCSAPPNESTSNLLTCDLGPMSAGSSATITFSVDTGNNVTVMNMAEVDPHNTTGDPNTANNTVTIFNFVP